MYQLTSIIVFETVKEVMFLASLVKKQNFYNDTIYNARQFKGFNLVRIFSHLYIPLTH